VGSAPQVLPRHVSTLHFRLNEEILTPKGFGGLAAANAVTYSGSSAFNAAPLAPYTVSGTQGGTFKQVGNFGFLRVFGAGHEVPFYQPQLALQVFKQTMSQTPLKST